MNQSALTHLVSRLRVKIQKAPRSFGNVDGPAGRIRKMRATVTALVRHERLELNYYRADEARPYMERLISEALRYGDTHRPTMELADYWLDDKTLVPKLFKVLVPRYQDWPPGLPYTRMLRAPSSAPPGVFAGQMTGDTTREQQDWFQFKRAVLELRGNPYPPLPGPIKQANPGLIHNVLLEEARKDYFMSQSKLARKAEEGVQALPEIDNADLDNSVDPDAITSEGTGGETKPQA